MMVWEGIAGNAQKQRTTVRGARFTLLVMSQQDEKVIEVSVV